MMPPLEEWDSWFKDDSNGDKYKIVVPSAIAIVYLTIVAY